MPKKDQGRCLVCGDVSVGINFGVPTCMPCKAFFRRNATKLGCREFVCEENGDCIISYEYRRTCSCCRLAKCFQVGMKKSFILSDQEREDRNKLVVINRLKRGQAPKIKCAQWMQAPALMRMTTNSDQWLSSTDQVVLSSIFNAYENTCILARNTTLKDFPVIGHTTIHGFVNEMSSEFEVSISYLKLIPEFDRIMADDKVRLIKNHIGTIVHISEPLMHPAASKNLIITWTNLFGLDLTTALLKRHQIIEQYICDPVLLKIFLIVLVLSTGNCRNNRDIDMDLICDDSLSILAAQNFYVELLWKYISSRSSNKYEAVRFFNKLIMYILFAQTLHLRIDDYVAGLRHEIIQMKPMMQSMWPQTDDEIDANRMVIAHDIII